MDAVRAHWRLASALILSGLTACAQTPRVLAPSDRSPVGGREALVVVQQGEIRGDIVQSHVGQAAAAGAAAVPFLGVLLAAAAGAAGGAADATVDQHRTKLAETAATPIRNGLEGYDFDRRALDSTRVTLLEMGWLGVSHTSFSKVLTDASLGGFLDESPAPEGLVAVYDYALTPDFSALRVGAAVTIYSKTPPAGDPVTARLELQNARYHQVFRCDYPLASADKSMDDNARLWAANHAAAARQALDLGLKCLSGLMQRGLEETPAQASALSRGAQITAGGETGKLIDKSNAGTLLLDPTNAWVLVASTPLG